jgi:hypothetical protein
MSYHLIFTTETQEDIREGFLWYEEKRIGLGIDFMLSIKQRSNLLNAIP